jgi:hypothetical protein
MHSENYASIFAKTTYNLKQMEYYSFCVKLFFLDKG